MRRANPSNRWLLSTNTDMMFLPLRGREPERDLRRPADGFYGLPRFELPEWLWERLPRSDPRAAWPRSSVSARRLRLDEPTLSNEWIRFDAPGDFQLVLREDFVAIDGFDEEMLLGYHVDSNLSRRMFLHRGSIESLEGSLAGYHCNHNRTRPSTTARRRSRTTSSDSSSRSIEPSCPEQRRTWGLADVELEEVPLRERSAPRSPLPCRRDSRRPGPRDAVGRGQRAFELTYDSGHVLPFVADSLAVSPSTRDRLPRREPRLERCLRARRAARASSTFAVARSTTRARSTSLPALRTSSS